MHSFHGYLLGLPAKLMDPGTILDDSVRTAMFDGRETNVLKVTYDAGVGQDTWYFYFDPSTSALVGSRFYHDESKMDGEYLVFEGEFVQDGLRLPKARKWYMNADSTYLGTDVIEGYAAQPVRDP